MISDQAVSEYCPPKYTNKTVKRSDKIIRFLLLIAASFSILIVFAQIFFLLREAIPALQFVSIPALLTGVVWNPTAINPAFGAAPLILGTLLVTLGAMIIAIPIGIASAIYISEIARPKVKNALKYLIELLSGIPSIVYGFFGMEVLLLWIRVGFNQPSGASWLAGSIILAIMALPTIISVSEDGLSAVPQEYREASIGMGATKWQTISHVVVPAAKPVITSAIILGMGRAIGETMAILMVTGNTPIIPSPITNIFSTIQTITAAVAGELPEVSENTPHYYVLFAIAVVLFLIVIVLNLIAEFILLHFSNSLRGKNPNKLNAAKSGKTTEFINILPLIFKILILALLIWLFATWWGIFKSIIIVIAGILLQQLYARIKPKIQQKVAIGILALAIGMVLIALVIILGFIVVNGLPAINLTFLTEAPIYSGRGGGILPAIIGTLYLVFGTILFAVPLGIGAGIYLAEYSRDNKFTRLVRIAIDNLNGTPSIIFGLFGFTVFVLYFNLGFSLLAGQLTLALMVLPTIIRTTENAIRTVSIDLRDGSYALGATKWQTIRKVVLPAASPGIITGIILSMGRAAGETAPIMFTAAVFMARYLPSSELQPVMALSYFLYILATSVPGGLTNAYGTALVLLIIVLAFYAIAMHYRAKMKKATTKSFIY